MIKTGSILIAALVLAGAATASTTQMRGAELVSANGCRGCHVIGEDGGSIGPSLNGLSERMSPEMIKAQLINPKTINPNSFMPSFVDLPEEDMTALVNYLSELK